VAVSIRVDDLLTEFGTALVSAQNRILKAAQENPSPLDGLRTAFSLSETDLELKLVFEESGGATEVRPVTVGESRLHELNPGVLSSLRAKILLVPEEEPAAPKRNPEGIRGEVLRRPDVQRLQKIFGALTVKSNFVPSARRWLVDVVEPGGLTLRSLQIDD
jgi:hypothetical protein